MQFSKKDLDIILKYVVEHAFKHKLSDYPELEEITGEEATPIVHDDTNKVLKLNNLIHVPAIKGEFDRVDHRISDLDESVGNKLEDMQNQIDGFDEHGLSVSTVFGDDPHIGISQKTITDAFNKIWQTFEDITGEAYRGISMIVTPSYYIGEDDCTVHIAATTMNTLGVFEEIEFYWNDDAEPFVFSRDPVSHFEFDTEISETTYIKCRAKIMGIWYEQTKLITNYSSFFLGSGDAYTDLLDSQGHFKPEYAIPVKRAAHDVEVGYDKHIIIAIGENLRDWFIRADLNGMEIAFNESEPVEVDGKNYIILTSEDTYQEGTINIDING